MFNKIIKKICKEDNYIRVHVVELDSLIADLMHGAIGLECNYCGRVHSKIWYVEKVKCNFDVEYRVVCERCV